MERPLSRLLLLSFGLLFTIFADLVESEKEEPAKSPPSPSPPPPPPPPPSPAPPRPPKGPSPPPPPFRPPPPKPPKNKTYQLKFRPPPSPPPNDNKLNTGQKIGLLFIGIGIILQIGVVGFLIFKRRQLLKVKGAYETCSSSS